MEMIMSMNETSSQKSEEAPSELKMKEIVVEYTRTNCKFGCIAQKRTWLQLFISV